MSTPTRIVTVFLALLLCGGTLVSAAPAVAVPAAPPDTAIQNSRIFLPSLRAPFSPPLVLAPGWRYTCALTTSGAALCWGNNERGQLGDSTKINRLNPIPVSGLSRGVVALAAGMEHTCALTAAGGALCWGSNYFGELGDGTETNRLTPTPVSGLGSGVAALVASNHTCALTAAGGALCWGWNGYGQLGDNTTTDRLIPTPVSSLASGVTALTAGDWHTCALTTSGDVLCWGGNVYGQLGDGTKEDRLIPTPVSGLASDVTALTAGKDHTCALTASGGVLCWGRNEFGQLGSGGGGVACGYYDEVCRLTPTPVSGLSSGVAAIAAGDDHTCALTESHNLVCWGGNWRGQLGDGTTNNYRLIPTPVSGLSSGVVAIAARGWHTCALTAAGGVLCWGLNDFGQLGDNTTSDRLTPTPVIWP